METVVLIRPASVSLIERCIPFPRFVAALFAALVYCFVPQSIADPDIWWHLRNAERQVGSLSFIVKDAYSFTANGAPWMNHEWLAELPYYLGWRLLGPRGLYLVMLGAIEVILLGVFYLAYSKSHRVWTAMRVSITAALLATVSFDPRTLLFGWICLVAELMILDRFSQDERPVWALPLLFLVWVNTHGSWLIGMVLLAVFLVCGSFNVSVGAIENTAWSPAQRRKLIVSFCLSVAALFLNPYGWRLVFYPFNLAFRQKLNIANVEEWRTLDFHSPRGHLLLVCLALLFLFQLIRRRTWAPYELAFLFIGVYASFTYSRFLFLAAILVLPLMAKDVPWADELRGGRSAASGTGRNRTGRNRPWLNAAILLVLLALLALRFPSQAKLTHSSQANFPEHALPYLSDFHPQGNVFNEYLWGGFLIWHTRQIPVFIDSRVDIFEYSGVFRDYLDAIRLKNTVAILDKYSIRYVLFEKDTPLVYFLQHTTTWKVDYEDQTTILLERSPATSPAKQ